MFPSCNRLAVSAGLVLAAIMPLAFPDHAARALAALHLNGPAALLLLVTAITGRTVRVHARPFPGALRTTAASHSLGLVPFAPDWRHHPAGAPIAVSVGGCLVPCALVAWEALALQQHGVSLALPALAVLITTAVCYALTRPRDGIGVPADITAFVAACAALSLAPEHAVPVACAAGTLGPLLGAELLHLGDSPHAEHAVVALGGAAAFDAMLLSCVVAVWLA